MTAPDERIADIQRTADELRLERRLARGTRGPGTIRRVVGGWLVTAGRRLQGTGQVRSTAATA
jgi:hypothetical protein